MNKRPYRTLLLPLGAILILVALLLRFPPDLYCFYPQCPIYNWTHLQCPGCGATRALAALLRGRLMEAMHLNILVVMLLPVLAAYVLLNCRRVGEGSDLHWFQPPPWTIRTALAAAAIFTIVRNLPR